MTGATRSGEITWSESFPDPPRAAVGIAVRFAYTRSRPRYAAARLSADRFTLAHISRGRGVVWRWREGSAPGDELVLQVPYVAVPPVRAEHFWILPDETEEVPISVPVLRVSKIPEFLESIPTLGQLFERRRKYVESFGTTPAETAALNRAREFFLRLEHDTNPDWLCRTSCTAEEAARRSDIRYLKPDLRDHTFSRGAATSHRREPLPLGCNQAQWIHRLSPVLARHLTSEFGPADQFQFDACEFAFLAFVSGRLVGDQAERGIGAPDSADFFSFAMFAILAIQCADPHASLWNKALPVFVRAADAYRHCAKPKFHGLQLNRYSVPWRELPANELERIRAENPKRDPDIAEKNFGQIIAKAAAAELVSVFGRPTKKKGGSIEVDFDS